MGMFDEIVVSRTYLKDLLTKEQEEILRAHDDIYQTKDLDNAMYRYRVYRRKLWKDDSSFSIYNNGQEEKKKPNWVVQKINRSISFYTNLTYKENDYWYEFQISFVDGKIDTKQLVDYSVKSKAEIEREEKEWSIISTYYDAHKNKPLVRLFSFLGSSFTKLSTFCYRRSKIPEEVKKSAYKAAGKEYKCYPNF
jgi:hypothetical protein